LNNTEVPAALIVFDRVNSNDKDFKKYWLLHCVEEPIISGNVTDIKRSVKGYNGRLVNTTLLPVSDNLDINKIGGKDNEFMVFGKNFPQIIRTEKNSADGAAWRIEVSPKKATNTDNFLNVMQVMDYDGGTRKPLTTEKIETDKFVGATIGNRIVLFSKNGDIINESFKIKLDKPAKVLITDVINGNWKVSRTDNSKNSAEIVKNDKQLLYFDAVKGSYTITKQ